MCVCVRGGLCDNAACVGCWEMACRKRAGLQGGVKEERGGTVAGGREGGARARGSKSQHRLCNRPGHTQHLKLIQSGGSTALPSAQDTQT